MFNFDHLDDQISFKYIHKIFFNKYIDFDHPDDHSHQYYLNLKFKL
jgi:hypothetical protein